MRALLIRHATSTSHSPDAPLSDPGYAQAAGLVPLLTRLQAGPLYTSPYRKAQDTITPYAIACSQPVTILEGLRERLLSPVDLPDWQDHVRRSFEDPTYAPEGGESHMDLQHRAAEALRKMDQAGGTLPTFATHGKLTSALFNAADPSFGFDAWRSLRNPDLFDVVLKDGTVIAFNRIELEEKT